MATAPEPLTKAVPPLQHRFGRGPEYRVGLEEELMLLDAETFALTPAIEPLAADIHSPEHLKRELMQSQVEVATTPARTVADALSELHELRAELVRAAGLRGVRVAGAGTHPFALAEDEPLTQGDRYRELAAEIRYPLRRTLCFGLHVHVSVAGGDKAIAVLEEVVPYLPLLLAASASSPFWRGQPSGLASTRTAVFQAMPRTGLPPVFADYADFAEQLDVLARTGAVADHSRFWWDARPHPKYGTVEVRIMDAQPCADDAVALAALVQALVRRAGSAYDRGERYAPYARAIVGENRWLAARHGLRAPLVDPVAAVAVPARTALEALLEELAGEADALGSGWAFARLGAMTDASADRQLRLVRHGTTLPGVLEALSDEMI